MKDKIAGIIANADTKDWKQIEVEFGDDFLDISVPPECEILQMKKMLPLTQSKQEIANALNNPIGSAHLSEVIQSKGKPVDEITVCVTVSDITRPAPYRGDNGILLPLFEIIENTGVKR